MKICAATLLISICLSGCTETSVFHPEFDKMKWMEGSWTMVKGDKSMTEIWSFKNDTSMLGQNYFVMENDTFVSERLAICIIDSTIYFLAKVLNQNQGKGIPFMLTKNEEGLHLFVNPNHDFPNNILYENRGNSIMYARVSGHIEGEYHEQEYLMKRNK